MGTHYEGTDEEVRALNAFIKLSRAGESMAAKVSELTQSYGLTVSQFGTLEALYHLGPMTQGAIAGKLLKSSGNMTLVVDNLESCGHVRRERNEADRRQVIVSLTEKGRDLIARIMPGHVEAIVEYLSVLTPEEQRELGRLCKILGTQRR